METSFSGDSNNGSDMNQVNGTGRMVIKKVTFLNRTGEAVDHIKSGEPVKVRVFYTSVGDVENPLLDVVIRDSASGNMFQATNRDFSVEFGKIADQGHIDIDIDSINSNNQVLNFFFTLWDAKHAEQFDWKRFVRLRVIGKPVSSGRILFNCNWENKVYPDTSPEQMIRDFGGAHL
jgi:hypothetical protein